jgi:hypothetical protein
MSTRSEKDQRNHIKKLLFNSGELLMVSVWMFLLYLLPCVTPLCWNSVVIVLSLYSASCSSCLDAKR